MPNSVDAPSSLQPGPSGVANPGLSSSTTARPPTTVEVQSPAVEVQSPAVDVQSPEAETHSPAADVQEITKLMLPLIPRKITKKQFPLLMCSENDIYDPILIETIQSYNFDFEENLVVPPHFTLNENYASYQRKTVTWMVNVERRNSINDQSQFTGGILADLLDEDKRLEMISCIVANTSPPIVFRQKVLLDGRSQELKSDYQVPLDAKCIISKINGNCVNIPKAFNTLTTDTSQSIIQRLSYKLFLSKINVESKNILACYCNDVQSESILLICGMCGEAQHESCVVYNPKIDEGLPYLCSSCWTFNDIIQCRATLIIVPDYCLEHWIQDVQKIVSPPLKCFVYNGMHSCKFMQPTIFNTFDVVLITYSKLAKEFNYGQRYVDDIQTVTSLRHFKKYPQSPLLCLNWWRICLDQPQIYNGNIDKVFEFLSPLKSGHKWILPGTLVQESSKNFFSIMKYLNLLGVKFDDYANFTKAIKEKPEDSILLFSDILWCNLIKDINYELNLPVPKFKVHWLSLSTIEQFFYQEIEKLFTVKTSHLKDKNKSVLMNKLMDIDQDTKQDIVGDILTLLEACVVPLIRGKYKLKMNGMFSLISSSNDEIKNRHDVFSEFLYQCVTNLKKLAKVLTLLPDDVEHSFYQYLVILMDIINKYHNKGSVSIGTDYQIIELIHTFLILLKKKSEIKHPVYTISYLENKIQNLESNILNLHSNNILHHRKMLQQKLSETNNIDEEINSLKSNDWWIRISECISSPSDFLTKVKKNIDSNRKAWIPNIVTKLESMGDVNFTLTNWLSKIVATRNNVLFIYKTLDENSNGNDNTFVCNKAICPNTNECLFCRFEHQLHCYKRLIINYNIENLDENIINNLIESNRENTMSQHEILLRSLILCERDDSLTDDYMKIAIERMEILNELSSEFLNVWRLWLNLDKYKNACQQLTKAKSIPTIDDVLAEIENPGHSIKKKKINDNVEITNLLRQHLCILRSENEHYLERLKTNHESLGFLRVIKYISNINMSNICFLCSACKTCPNELVVLYCYHILCSYCLIKEYNSSNSIDLRCPKCCVSNSMENMECFKQNQKTSVKMIGSYSTKLRSIVCKLKKVIALDQCSKVIIFSSLKTSLDSLSSALSLNSIKFTQLDLGCSNNSTVLNDFKNSEDMTTILINLNIELNNMKLNFATRVFFMEPIMDKSFENQIFDQICCKQIKQTYVHHFIIKNSIEEKIAKTFINDDPLLGADLTLSQLSELLINKKHL